MTEVNRRSTLLTIKKIEEFQINEIELKRNNKKLKLENRGLEICLGHLYDNLTGLKNINKQLAKRNKMCNVKTQTSNDLENEYFFGILVTIFSYIVIFIISFLIMKYFNG